MASGVRSGSQDVTSNEKQQQLREAEEKRHRSIFEVPPDFFESCRLLSSPSSISVAETFESFTISGDEALHDEEENERKVKYEGKNPSSTKNSMQRWSCNTCKDEFESLEDQRSHFKSDIHRFNIKLRIAGKDIVKEEDFDESTCDSLFKEYDMSSISGSEDEDDGASSRQNDTIRGSGEVVKKKMFIHLQTGQRVSIWKCLFLDESESVAFENDKSVVVDNSGFMPFQTEREVIEKLKRMINEPRNKTHLRAVLLASGGHFAGCIFDGNSVVAHKTFHRYVVRAKAGKKQSSKDASGRAAHSAGASLRRHNELALKKEIQDLLAAWKPYFDASSCIFVYAPSNNHHLLFDGGKTCLSCPHYVVKNVPVTVRRPTFKEGRRIYNLLTQVCYEVDEHNAPNINGDSLINASIISNDQQSFSKVDFDGNLVSREASDPCSSVGIRDNVTASSESEENVIGKTTPLHGAARSGNAEKVLELLEQGLDPCIKDERGQSPYMLAAEKEVRNTFRRFMASNLDRWDWHAAKVPSALTKEMEECQAAKQAEKDAKRKARSKELKKLHREKEKKAQAQAAQSRNVPSISHGREATSVAVLKGVSETSGGAHISKEEELKRARDAEREKRAAAAERRIAAAAALKAEGAGSITAPSGSVSKGGVATDISCSLCDVSLAGKIPFHRYNYKYCSTSCMHAHREILEDG